MKRSINPLVSRVFRVQVICGRSYVTSKKAKASLKSLTRSSASRSNTYARDIVTWVLPPISRSVFGKIQVAWVLWQFAVPLMRCRRHVSPNLLELDFAYPCLPFACEQDTQSNGNAFLRHI